MSELLTKKSDGYYRGCGCAQKVQDKVTPPEGSVELFVQHNGRLTGPVSGIKYLFSANSVAIDVDPADARTWRESGVGKDAPPGFKGQLTRQV